MAVIPGLPQQQHLESLGLSKSQQTTKAADSTTDFLNLFVAQLQNQNPLEPQEGADFLAQLAQFSTVEGIQNLDKSFNQMASSLQSTTALQASSMVGRQVEVPSSTVTLNNGQAVRGSIEVPASITDLKLEIADASGNVIKTLQLGSASPGEESFVWNGLDDNGAQLANGNYQIRASGTIDGKQTEFVTLTRANVDSVTIDKNSQSLILNVSGYGPMSIDDVRTIS